jgi:4-diphosphocytidyl-2-C-methyl-D-erythritol kinase
VLGVERGDLLFPLLDAPVAWAVIVVPDFGVSTRDAYAWWDDEFDGRRSRLARTAGPEREITNDLQAPVVARHPRISRLISRLRAAGASRAAMSGSGSAVFGLFSTRAAAELAARNLGGRQITAYVTRTLSRREFQRVSAVHSAGE